MTAFWTSDIFSKYEILSGWRQANSIIIAPTEKKTDDENISINTSNIIKINV